MKTYQATGCRWPDTTLARFIDRHGYGSLAELQAASVRDPQTFWSQVVDSVGLEWTTPYARTVDLSAGPMWPDWFVDGRLDLFDNLVAKHARRQPDKPALRWESDGGEVEVLSYARLAEEVEQLAAGLAGLGVGTGDRVAMYLPMVPEAAILMLATARLGAIVIPLFSGYGADSVAARVRDAEARVLVCADGYLRRGKAVNMLGEARRAAAGCPSLEHLVVVRRLGDTPLQPDADVPEIACRDLPAAPLAASTGVAADTPLMVIYTSGTTGRPKGVVHTHAGLPLKAAQDLQMAFDLGADDTLMWVSDMGWLMGPWMVFGALLLGATIVLYEGTADYPDAGRLWQVVKRHRVTHLGLSPTLVRLLMAAGDEHLTPADLASLRIFGSTGEPWNETPWVWLFERVGGGRCPIINYSGGTEIGGGILAGFPGLPQQPGSFSGPVPGMAADVLDADGVPVCGEVGELVVKAPWPGMTRGFWRDDERYLATYWNRWPGVWVHGDWARIDDASGMWFVHGRSDDTIKVAGKRVGPADYESALTTHPVVTEAVAVGVPDAVKGEAAVCFVTVADPGRLAGCDWAQWEKALARHVGAVLGKPLAPSRVHLITELPKTKNGKILRRLVKSAYLGEAPGDLSSLDNPAALDDIRASGRH